MSYSPVTDAERLATGLSARYCQELNSPVKPTLQLQRVVVRLLFDPAFVDQVYSDTDAALSNLDISDKLRKQLVSNDRRVWSIDQLRQRRTLSTLIEEFKVSSALFLDRFGKLADLEAFFSAPIFHQCVQYRGHLAIAFGEFLFQTYKSEHSKDACFAAFCAVLCLELRMCVSRRELSLQSIKASRKLLASGIQTGFGVQAAEISDAAFEVLRIVNEYLFEVSLIPALTLCHDAPRIGELPTDFTASKWYLFEPQNSRDVQVDVVEERYGRLIRACQTSAQSTQSLKRKLREFGFGKAQIRAMVDALLRANVLVES